MDKSMSDAKLEAVLSGPDKVTYSKHETRHRKLENSWVDAKAETPSAKNGTIEGYASQFNVVDHQREIVRPGAFAKTIAEQDGKIVLSAKHFAHGGDLENAVATVTELREDDYGLWFKAEWYGDEASQKIRDKVLVLRASGVKVYTSIGYRLVKYNFIKSETDDMTLVELNELALKEITITLSPANEGAVVLDAKDEDGRDGKNDEGNKGGDGKDANTDGAGSSPADNGQGPVKPQVADGVANATAKAQEDVSPAAGATAANVDAHSTDATVISANARAISIKAKLLAMSA